jgi:hypothetical protein
VTADLPPILWIGGGTGGGKTSIAARLAAAHGLTAYHYDRVEPAQIARMTPDRQPRFTRFLAMSMDERWVHTSATALFELVLETQDERFALVLEDLAAMPRDRTVVAEGFGLRPDLVAPLLDDPRRAVWLLPTREFRVASLERDGRLWRMPNQTSNPPRALSNRLGRDELLTRHTRREAAARGFATIEVDGTRSLDEVTALVERQFAPWLPR